MKNILLFGYGHTSANIKEGQTITEIEAEELLKKDLQKIIDYILKKYSFLELNQRRI